MVNEDAPSASFSSVSIASDTTTIRELIGLLTEVPIPLELDIAILEDSDLFFVKEEQNLGLNAAKLPLLASAVRRQYQQLRCHRRADITTANKDDELQFLDDVTKCLLLVCPDHSTAWADRRRRLLLKMHEMQSNHDANCNITSLLQQELSFLNLLVTKHSKAPSSWAHRKWVGRQLVASSATATHPSTWSISNWAQSEMDTCTLVAERFPKNYYAWTHRYLTLQTYIASLQQRRQNDGDSNKEDDVLERSLLVLGRELQSMEPWLRRHVSDHAAAHYAGQLLLLLLCLEAEDENTTLVHHQNDVLSIIEEANQAAKRLVALYPTHEVMWIYRRFCAYAMLKVLLKQGKSRTTQPEELKTAFDTFHQTEIADEWKCFQNDKPPIIGERLNEWNKTQTYRLSYIVWIVEQSYSMECLNDDEWRSTPHLSQEIRDLAISTLRDFDHIPYNIWRLGVFSLKHETAK